jgi:hypothetical protein
MSHFQDWAHGSDDSSAQSLKCEAVAGIRETIVMVLTDSLDVEAGKACT